MPGRPAGLSVGAHLNCTTAARAYGFDRSAVEAGAVFRSLARWAPSTFSVLRIANGVFDVKATSG